MERSKLGEEIRKSAIESLTRILEKSDLPHDLDVTGVSLIGNVVEVLYSNGILEEKDITDIAHRVIIAQGKKDYERAVKHKFEIDHGLMFPEYLAYAIVNDQISLREQGKLRYCHGSIEDFASTYGRNGAQLLANMTEKLIHPPDFVSEMKKLDREKPNSSSHYYECYTCE